MSQRRNIWFIDFYDFNNILITACKYITIVIRKKVLLSADQAFDTTLGKFRVGVGCTCHKFFSKVPHRHPAGSADILVFKSKNAFQLLELRLLVLCLSWVCR